MGKDTLHFAGERIDLCDSVDLIAEKLHADGVSGGACRENLNRIPSYAEFVSDKIDIISFILYGNQFGNQCIARILRAVSQRNNHVSVIDRVADGIDARNGCNDDHISSFRKRGGSAVAEFIDLLIYSAVFSIYVSVVGTYASG